VHLSGRGTIGRRETSVIDDPEWIRRFDHGGQDAREGPPRPAPRSGAAVWFREPAGGPGAGDPALACRLDQRRERRSFRAEEALRAKVPEGSRGHGDRAWRAIVMGAGLGDRTAPRSRLPPGKAQAALDVAGAPVAAPVADRANETLPRFDAESARRMGQRISPSRLPVVPRKKGALPASGPAPRRKAGGTPRRLIAAACGFNCSSNRRRRAPSCGCSPTNRRRFRTRLIKNAAREIFLIVDRGSADRANKANAFAQTPGGKLRLFFPPPYGPARNRRVAL
jgi:hypothetical protein